MDHLEDFIERDFFHVYNRGNRRDTLFQDQSDYLFFLQRLQEYSARHLILTHVYCLMPNHYHLVLSQSSANSISECMQTLSTSVTKHFNTKYQTVGHLFQ